ncbi:bifunctional hydroxymethylpyrimidine kinase/phosphomethylpyrimidine kinase [Gilvimarinus xylanilyticus]|uniref:hydroxymethylpyrimidine kinase n=1 Tax=Gilvimarinus xylanilyticus TaxID=2944139 RepID=A0A9X2KTX9_9GAMM|nr:hydroxymethylpyrimidine/phosphomethylpyrimidine kinase [Gilvimarinus xylanilyticus]MCP8899759.1 hydroxymethylpyrimidine/phosphomethylpyrimidine kinase [Gilvimarinus xylanilyticus]
MRELIDTKPAVLSLSSHDPSGCTGIQADIETSLSLGVHCCALATVWCARDTRRLLAMQPCDTGFFIEQARSILEDIPVAAIKLGHFSQVAQIEAVHSILQDYPQIPVVLDPVLQLSIQSGEELAPTASEPLIQALLELLLPLATIVTPDSDEAAQLAHQADCVDACGRELLNRGAEAVLITGAKRTPKTLENRLYQLGHPARLFSWERLNISSCGAGATLSASVCAYLAHGLLLSEAVQQAQRFTWNSLQHSYRVGMGHSAPDRLFWASKKQ